MSDPRDDLKFVPPVTDDPAPETNPVDEAVGREARVMLKGIKLPDSGPLAPEQRHTIRETLKAHLAQHKVTYRDVSKQIGYSESTISEVLQDKYHRADPDPILRKLSRWVDDDTRRRERAKPLGFYPTSVFTSVRGLATYVKSNARLPGAQRAAAIEQEAARIAIGWGPAGCGKSLGARALHAEEVLSILVRVQARCGTDIGLARLIQEAAGLRGTPRGRNLIEFIIDHLRDSARLLIIDEGHRLQPSGCELLRDLADVCGIPILILATHEFYERLTKVRTSSGNMFYAQFSRRVGYVCDLVRGLDGKGGSKRPIFSVDEVRRIFNSDTIKLTPEALDYLQAIACCVALGMLGLAANVYELATRSALRGTKVIDVDLLRKSARRVLIPAGVADHGILTQIEASLQTNQQLRAASA